MQRPSVPTRHRVVSLLAEVSGWDAIAQALDVALGRTRQRELESRLVAAQQEIDRLRARLADVTRPPAQFARMRAREEAVVRLARLRRARRVPEPVESLTRR